MGFEIVAEQVSCGAAVSGMVDYFVETAHEDGIYDGTGDATMGLMTGKKGLVFGLINDYSIAWGITQTLHEQGATMGFSYLPDKDNSNPKMRRRVEKLVLPIGANLLVPCDVQSDDDLDKAFAAAKEAFGTLDFVVHSVAFAPTDDIQLPVYGASRNGFKTAMDISVYSLAAICRRAMGLMPNGGNILTLSYLGGERVIPGYNLMGLCKAALESSVGYLAHELGPSNIRVNAISAGPIKTLSSSAVKGIDSMLELYEGMAPMRKNVDIFDVGRSSLYLLSDLSSGVTGETLHVDSGFHVMAAPPPEMYRS